MGVPVCGNGSIFMSVNDGMIKGKNCDIVANCVNDGVASGNDFALRDSVFPGGEDWNIFERSRLRKGKLNRLTGQWVGAFFRLHRLSVYVAHASSKGKIRVWQHSSGWVAL
jgi:hypothetical protein